MDRIWLTRFLIDTWLAYDEWVAIALLVDNIDISEFIDEVSRSVFWIISLDDALLLEEYSEALKNGIIIRHDLKRRVRKVIIDYIRTISARTWWIIWDLSDRFFVYPNEAWYRDSVLCNVLQTLNQYNWQSFEIFVTDRLIRLSDRDISTEDVSTRCYLPPYELDHEKIDLLAKTRLVWVHPWLISWIQVVSFFWWDERGQSQVKSQSYDRFRLKERDLEIERRKIDGFHHHNNSPIYELWKFSRSQTPNFLVLLYPRKWINFEDLRKWFTNWNSKEDKTWWPSTCINWKNNSTLDLIWNVTDIAYAKVLNYILHNRSELSLDLDDYYGCPRAWREKAVFDEPYWGSYSINAKYRPRDMSIDVRLYKKSDWLRDFTFWLRFYITKNLLQELSWWALVTWNNKAMVNAFREAWFKR